MNNKTAKSLSGGQKLLLEELTKRDVNTEEIGGTNIVIISQKKKKRILLDNYTSLVPYNIGLLISNKYFCRELLKDKAIQVADGKIFNEDKGNIALRYANELGYPIILRQENSQLPEKSITNIKSDREFLVGFNTLARLHENILVEKMIKGNNLRIFINSAGFINVLEKATKSSITFVTKQTNIEYLNTSSHKTSISTTYIDITKTTHISFLHLAKKILHIFSPMPYICFGMITKNSSLPLRKSYNVTEIYHSPCLHLQYFARKGNISRKVVDLIADDLFPDN